MRLALATCFTVGLLSPALGISPVDSAALEKVPAGEVYRGKPRLPDFNGRDRQHRDFRTRIITGMKAGASFAGHLALVEIGCGAGCRFVLVGDLKTGEVCRFPLGGEDNLSLRIYYRPDSRSVVAYWQDNGRCLRSVVAWRRHEFRSKKLQT